MDTPEQHYDSIVETTKAQSEGSVSPHHKTQKDVLDCWKTLLSSPSSQSSPEYASSPKEQSNRPVVVLRPSITEGSQNLELDNVAGSSSQKFMPGFYCDVDKDITTFPKRTTEEVHKEHQNPIRIIRVDDEKKNIQSVPVKQSTSGLGRAYKNLPSGKETAWPESPLKIRENKVGNEAIKTASTRKTVRWDIENLENTGLQSPTSTNKEYKNATQRQELTPTKPVKEQINLQPNERLSAKQLEPNVSQPFHYPMSPRRQNLMIKPSYRREEILFTNTATKPNNSGCQQNQYNNQGPKSPNLPGYFSPNPNMQTYSPSRSDFHRQNEYNPQLPTTKNEYEQQIYNVCQNVQTQQGFNFNLGQDIQQGSYSWEHPCFNGTNGYQCNLRPYNLESNIFDPSTQEFRNSFIQNDVNGEHVYNPASFARQSGFPWNQTNQPFMAQQNFVQKPQYQSSPTIQQTQYQNTPTIQLHRSHFQFPIDERVPTNLNTRTLNADGQQNMLLDDHVLGQLITIPDNQSNFDQVQNSIWHQHQQHNIQTATTPSQNIIESKLINAGIQYPSTSRVQTFHGTTDTNGISKSKPENTKNVNTSMLTFTENKDVKQNSAGLKSGKNKIIHKKSKNNRKKKSRDKKMKTSPGLAKKVTNVELDFIASPPVLLTPEYLMSKDKGTTDRETRLKVVQRKGFKKFLLERYVNSATQNINTPKNVDFQEKENQKQNNTRKEPGVLLFNQTTVSKSANKPEVENVFATNTVENNRSGKSTTETANVSSESYVNSFRGKSVAHIRPTIPKQVLQNNAFVHLSKLFQEHQKSIVNRDQTRDTTINQLKHDLELSSDEEDGIDKADERQADSADISLSQIQLDLELSDDDSDSTVSLKTPSQENFEGYMKVLHNVGEETQKNVSRSTDCISI